MGSWRPNGSNDRWNWGSRLVLKPISAVGLMVLAGLAVGPVVWGQTGETRESAASDVRVMSFNIRFGTANDGENRWPLRQDFVVETIRAFDPDLLGTQETLADQRDFLAEKLSDYDFAGVGRDDGQLAGEMMAIYWKRDRFEKLAVGHFWLSETPEEIGSRSWDTSLPRMVTWVKLRDLRQPDAPPIAWFNTHFDHRGQEARLESARLIRRKALELAADHHLIVTGDFNAGEDSPPYAALFAAAEPGQPALVDTYRQQQPERGPDEGTFSGFDAETTRGARIDWVAACDRWQVIAAAIDRTQRDGRTPSDHFPVTAVLRRKP